jgi:cysteinyl-tRNA synthetase
LKDGSFSAGKSPEAEQITTDAIRNFDAFMDDDLNISGALAALFEMIRDVNKLADSGSLLADDISLIRAAIKKMDQVFDVINFPHESISDEIEQWIEKRNDARRRKDFKTSDEIRDMLKNQGIILEDTPAGTRWKKA